ncbi:hypothetical protein OKW43_006399 [Paraburkholderia sp. WC7.3g]|uniref:hypothetical protein n=1 Tax=Paraburkholderia sp. WC7.3g TaxID=2991070 RepID=UPI003D202F6F
MFVETVSKVFLCSLGRRKVCPSFRATRPVTTLDCQIEAIPRSLALLLFSHEDIGDRLI